MVRSVGWQSPFHHSNQCFRVVCSQPDGPRCFWLLLSSVQPSSERQPAELVSLHDVCSEMGLWPCTMHKPADVDRLHNLLQRDGVVALHKLPEAAPGAAAWESRPTGAPCQACRCFSAASLPAPGPTAGHGPWHGSRAAPDDAARAAPASSQAPSAGPPCPLPSPLQRPWPCPR